MKIVKGDIWMLYPTHCLVIPTNLAGSMGRGLARQARDKFIGLEREYKRWCKQEHRGCIFIHHDWPQLILLPVKYHWSEIASLELIDQNLAILANLSLFKDKPIALPRLGCGFGERQWHEVKPIIEKHWQENWILVVATKEVFIRYSDSFCPGTRIHRNQLN